MKILPVLNLLASSLVMLAGIQSSHAIEWEKLSDPAPMVKKAGGQIKYNLKSLAKKGKLDKVPWPDSYWPRNKMGVARRFQEEIADAPLRVERKRKTVKKEFTKDEVKKMTLEQKNLLSPMEKMDLANCDYDWTLSKKELKAHRPSNAAWEGNCNGWTGCALNFDEPGKCSFVNDDGIEIPFSSSDIKGLLGYNFSRNGHKNETVLCGRRTGETTGWKAFFGSKHIGINAGSFHLLLANMYGELGIGMGMDRDPSKQVWNHPIYAYDTVSMIPATGKISKDAAKGTVQEYIVETDVFYVIEIRNPSAEPQLGGELHKINATDDEVENGFIVKKRYKYALETDYKGDVIGGHWLDNNEYDHPDFVWIQDVPAFEGNFKHLKKIYEDSIKK